MQRDKQRLAVVLLMALACSRQEATPPSSPPPQNVPQTASGSSTQTPAATVTETPTQTAPTQTASSTTETASQSDAQTPPKKAAGFVDRVWSVSRSTAVAEGTRYLFRADGTLIITSPQALR